MYKYKLFLKLVNFLVDGQTTIGGWGNEPGPQKEANPLNTSEVLLGLILASDHLVNIGSSSNLEISIDKGIDYLMKTQLSSGGWSTGSAYLVSPILAQGNIVSTCISLWAIIEYSKRHQTNRELKYIINKGYRFVCDCIGENNCVYSPNLESMSVVASAYCLLSLCIINESSQINDNLLNKISQVINIIECDFTEEFECKAMVALLSFIGIKILKKKMQPSRHISNFYDKIKEYVKSLNDSTVTSSIIEKQVVREIGKSKRDYNHYMPFWYSIALLMCPDVIKTEQLPNALYVLSRNIEFEEDGGVVLGGKGLTWATGQTLMAYCYYFDIIDVENILKLEGFSMANRKNIFVVHGRNIDFKSKIFEYLRLIGLNPLEWETIIPCSGAPFTFEVVENGLKQAQACLILLTGDDEAKCADTYILPSDADYEKVLTPQPRLNVVFEAGMAFALYKNRTVIIKLGGQRKFSDIDGINYISLDNIDLASASFKTTLNSRLRMCGCELDTEKRSAEWIDFKF